MSYKNKNIWRTYCLDNDPNEIEGSITEKTIVSNDKKIHLDIYGIDDNLKITILFIHGTSVYSRFYSDFLFSLYKEGYRIVAPDMPGHGLSEGKRGHFDMKLLTSTIYDVTSYIIENFGENVVVMGSSLGGITSLYSVANDPRIKAAVCHNAAIFNRGAHKKIVKVSGIYKILKPFVPYFAKLFPTLRISVWIYLDIKNFAYDQKLLDMVDIVLDDPLLSDRYTLKSLATQMRAPLARPVQRIETPVMIINGDSDVLFNVDYMQEIIDSLENSRNKRLEIIPNALHLILHEFKEESIKRITKWLDEVL